MRGDRPRVVLDAGPAAHQQAGLARYTERLAHHLHRDQGHRVDLTLFYNRHSGHHLPATLRALPQRSLPLGQYLWRLSALASQLLHLPLHERLLPPGVLYHATEHLLPRLARPTVLTVHDLIFERYPQHHTRTNRLFLKLGMPLFVRAADRIIAVSKQTRRDLIELYDVPSERITVIYEGVDERFRPASLDEIERVRATYGIRAPYLLMVGTLEPRKNHATALRVLARLKAQGHPHSLVIVGGHGWLFDPIRELVQDLTLTEDVIFTGRVPDDDLPALYSGAACFLMPSLYEGFGFPALEAQACGIPVICSNVSSLPEVAGEDALLVAPLDLDGWVRAAGHVIERGQLHRPQPQVRFSWERCTMETADLYCDLSAQWEGRR